MHIKDDKSNGSKRDFQGGKHKGWPRSCLYPINCSQYRLVPNQPHPTPQFYFSQKGEKGISPFIIIQLNIGGKEAKQFDNSEGKYTSNNCIISEILVQIICHGDGENTTTEEARLIQKKLSNLARFPAKTCLKSSTAAFNFE